MRAILLAAFSAATGGALRRALGQIHLGPLTQAFAAGTVAGMIGAAAVHLDIGAAALPGPPILNGAMDLLALRMPLGIARLGFATMVLTSIGAGLILGLRIGGQTLAVNGGDSTVPIYADVLAAGIAAASYAVYFSMPYRTIVWPVLAGMAARGVHLVGGNGVGRQPGDRGLPGLPVGRYGSGPDRPQPANALRGNRIRSRGGPGPRRIRVPHAKRFGSAARWCVAGTAGDDSVERRHRRAGGHRHSPGFGDSDARARRLVVADSGRQRRD